MGPSVPGHWWTALTPVLHPALGATTHSQQTVSDRCRCPQSTTRARALGLMRVTTFVVRPAPAYLLSSRQGGFVGRIDFMPALFHGNTRTYCHNLLHDAPFLSKSTQCPASPCRDRRSLDLKFGPLEGVKGACHCARITTRYM